MNDANAAFQPGMGLDEAAETRLKDAALVCYKALQAPKPDYEALAKDIAAARKDAEALLVLAEKSDRPVAVDTPALPSPIPVIVPEGATHEQVLAGWKEQLVLRVKSVYEVLSGEILMPLPKWDEAIGVSWRHKKNLAKRAGPTAATMREAHAFALLLGGRQKIVRVKCGETLFEDDLKKNTDNWHLYGPCITTQDENGLRRKNKRVRHSDTVMWTKKEFDGNVLYEITVVPNNSGRAGVLFPICGRPVKKGTDLSVSVGQTMETYNYGVHAYHFSVHRSETGICNGRKVGTGLHLIGSRTPDPCEEVGRAYRVAVGKWENNVFFLVDGKLQHCYYDAGTFGPPLEGGSVGTRHWGGADGTYRDAKVSRLVAME